MMVSINQASSFDNDLVLYFFSAIIQVLGTMVAILVAFYPTTYKNIKEELVIKLGKFDDLFRWFQTIRYTKGAIENFERYDKMHNIMEQLTNVKLTEDNLDHIREDLYQLLSESRKKTDETNHSLLECMGSILDLSLETYRQAEYLHRIKKRIASVLKFNVIVLILFIMSFFFLPAVKDNFLYLKIAIGSGITLASVSIYTLIIYILDVVKGDIAESLFGFNEIVSNLKIISHKVKTRIRLKLRAFKGT